MKTEQTGTPYTVDQMIEAIQLVMTERDRLKVVNAEMLEALKQIHQLWCCPGPKYAKDWSARCDVMADYARAAIKKAEAL